MFLITCIYPFDLLRNQNTVIIFLPLQIELNATKGMKRIFYYQCTGAANLKIVDPSSVSFEPVAAFHGKN